MVGRADCCCLLFHLNEVLEQASVGGKTSGQWLPLGCKLEEGIREFSGVMEMFYVMNRGLGYAGTCICQNSSKGI